MHGWPKTIGRQVCYRKSILLVKYMFGSRSYNALYAHRYCKVYWLGVIAYYIMCTLLKLPSLFTG